MALNVTLYNLFSSISFKLLNVSNIEMCYSTWKQLSKQYDCNKVIFDGIVSVLQELKSKHIKMGIVTSQEFEQYKKGDGSSEHKTYYEGQLVAGEIITDKINNRFSNAVVRILREPILGELAYMKGQVTQVSNIYLSVPIRLEIDTYKLRDYLLRRILRKDRRKNKQNERSIRLETLWTFMEIEEDEYMTRMRTLEKIEKMLSYWQKEKMIADYQVFNDKIIVRLLKK